MWFGLITRRELERHDAEMKNEFRKLEVEWDGWYDKFRRLYARLSKRVGDAAAADERDDGASVEASDGHPERAAPASGRLLSARRTLRGF
jgi:hypothetical protein